MVISKSATYNNLKKKGFTDSTSHSKDHKYLELVVDGKVVLYTKMSHGSGKELDAWHIHKMAEQCKFIKEEFADLAKCPMTAEQYFQLLKDNGIL